MKFGTVDIADASGAILAHSVSAGGRVWRKGQVLTGEIIAELGDAGVARVTVARLDPEDTGEDEAAAGLAQALENTHISLSKAFTGRANLIADQSGVLTVSAKAVARINGIDEAITLATLPHLSRVSAGQMIATVKMIPYGVNSAALAQACEVDGPVLTLHPFCVGSASVILTTTDGMKPSLSVKAREVIGTRLAGLGVGSVTYVDVAHKTADVAKAVAAATGDMILILGASATSDRRDVCPAGLVAAGGTLERFGMPVDPGNLLFLGHLGRRPVIGLPGCARSPALNGADWVLERIAAGLEVRSADIATMGVGGLLKEIPSRPQPRRPLPRRKGAPRVSIVLLAAGASRRMDGADKTLEPVDGQPLLARIADRCLASAADRTYVVLPPDRADRATAVAHLKVTPVIAQDAASGMAASLAAGVAAARKDADALMVVLADMPEITTEHINRMIAEFGKARDKTIVRATDSAGVPGHPVLFDARYFDALGALSGDNGAKDVLGSAPEQIALVPLDAEAATTDLDTPAAWSEWRRKTGISG